LAVDDESWSNVIPFPLDREGAVALDVVLPSAQTVTLQGERIENGSERERSARTEGPQFRRDLPVGGLP
jgi:hypothetical protein